MERTWDTPKPPKQPWAKQKAKDLPLLQHTVSGNPVFVLTPRHVASIRFVIDMMDNSGVKVPGHCKDLIDLMAKLVQARAKEGAGRMTRAEVNESGVRTQAELALATSPARAASVGKRILPTISKVFLVCNARHYLKKNIIEHGPEVAHAMALENSFVLSQLLRFDNVKMRGDELARMGASVGMTYGNCIACMRRLRDLTYITLEHGNDEDGTDWYRPSVRWETLPEFRIRADSTKAKLDRQQIEYDLGLRVDIDPPLPSLAIAFASKQPRAHATKDESSPLWKESGASGDGATGPEA
jgi:hypothetical protein